jgi:uncharacterized membrane protein YphA (DoxX/SURF4 family)
MTKNNQTLLCRKVKQSFSRNMTKRIEIYGLISGMVFLISGMAKSLDISVFSNTVSQYGFESLQFISPVIVLVEVFVGLFLVFQVWQKTTAIVGALLVLIFTAIFAYGVIFRGIDDCGCFGIINALNTSPVFTFLRNGVLLYLLVAILCKGENKDIANKWAVVVMLIFMFLAAFMSGFTYRNVNENHAQKHVAQAVKDTYLTQLVSMSPDSTYLIFVFSYTCPHCLNSIANLKEYESSGMVDKVIGLAWGDSAVRNKFNEIFLLHDKKVAFLFGKDLEILYLYS